MLLNLYLIYVVKLKAWKFIGISMYIWVGVTRIALILDAVALFLSDTFGIYIYVYMGCLI